MKPFREHVFISYAHLDNLPVYDQVGWVANFRLTFSRALSERLGLNADPIIWFDTEKLQGNSALTPEILKALAGSAALISVLSPSYIESDWCRQELHEFCALANQSGGLLVDNKARVFKVVKLPPDSLEILPNPLHDIKDYHFFKEEDGIHIQLDPSRNRREFVDATVRLAADATRLIKELQKESTTPEAAAGAGESGSTTAGAPPIRIYLADCTYDLRETRERLAADQKQSGYLVFPDRTLPAGEQTEYCAAVRQACQECDIAIHMIGNRYGTMPETADPQPRSVVELQNGIAAELAGSTTSGQNLRRLIWLPAELKPADPLQRAFVERLEREADLQVGADLIRGDFEELRTTLERLIKARRQALAAPPEAPFSSAAGSDLQDPPNDKPMVYLMSTEEDIPQTLDLKRWLRQQGFEVERPLFQGDATEVRQTNQALLRHCCAAVCFYGAGTDLWFRSIRTDLRKINIHRQGLPPIPRLIYVAEPDTLLKQEQVEDPDGAFTAVIDGRGGFDGSPMAAALGQAMAQAGGRADG